MSNVSWFSERVWIVVCCKSIDLAFKYGINVDKLSPENYNIALVSKDVCDYRKGTAQMTENWWTDISWMYQYQLLSPARSQS